MPDSRPDPFLIADAPGLDFLNSVASPYGAPIEWLDDGRDLIAWLDRAEMIPADVVRSMQSQAAGELDAAAAQARALREWFRGFVHAHAGHPLQLDAIAELDRLNRLLARDEAYGAIVPSDDPAHTRPPRWEWRRHWRSPDALLLPIARAMADLVCEADFSRIKSCEGSGCTMLFLDTTKAKGRRWCSMAVCGNRAKQAAHRARTREPPPCR